MAGLPPGWEMDYDGTRWFYKYKATGFVQYHFPKDGDEFMDFIDPSTPVPQLAPEERLESQQQVKRQSSQHTKSDAERWQGRMSATGGPVSFILEDVFAPSATENSTAEREVFQPESYMYLGPGAYTDVSPMMEEEDEAARRVVAGGSPSISEGMATPMGSTIGKVGQSPQVPQASPEMVQVPLPTPPNIPVEVEAREQVQMLDSREVPYELPVEERFDPVGVVAEMATETTLQGVTEPQTEPVELATEISTPQRAELPSADLMEMGDNAIRAPIEMEIPAGYAELADMSIIVESKPTASEKADPGQQTQHLHNENSPQAPIPADVDAEAKGPAQNQQLKIARKPTNPGVKYRAYRPGEGSARPNIEPSGGNSWQDSSQIGSMIAPPPQRADVIPGAIPQALAVPKGSLEQPPHRAQTHTNADTESRNGPTPSALRPTGYSRLIEGPQSSQTAQVPSLSIAKLPVIPSKAEGPPRAIASHIDSFENFPRPTVTQAPTDANLVSMPSVLKPARNSRNRFSLPNPPKAFPLNQPPPPPHDTNTVSSQPSSSLAKFPSVLKPARGKEPPFPTTVASIPDNPLPRKSYVQPENIESTPSDAAGEGTYTAYTGILLGAEGEPRSRIGDERPVRSASAAPTSGTRPPEITHIQRRQSFQLDEEIRLLESEFDRAASIPAAGSRGRPFSMIEQRVSATSATQPFEMSGSAQPLPLNLSRPYPSPPSNLSPVNAKPSGFPGEWVSPQSSPSPITDKNRRNSSVVSLVQSLDGTATFTPSPESQTPPSISSPAFSPPSRPSGLRTSISSAAGNEPLAVAPSATSLGKGPSSQEENPYFPSGAPATQAGSVPERVHTEDIAPIQQYHSKEQSSQGQAYLNAQQHRPVQITSSNEFSGYSEDLPPLLPGLNSSAPAAQIESTPGHVLSRIDEHDEDAGHEGFRDTASPSPARANYGALQRAAAQATWIPPPSPQANTQPPKTSNEFPKLVAENKWARKEAMDYSGDGWGDDEFA